MKSLLRFAVSLAGSALLPFLASAQAPASGANSTGPVIKFNDESHDFGKALANDTVSYTYIVTNTGDSMLDILGVKPGCSCTVVNGTWTEHIAPHQTGIIPVSVHTSTTGPIDKPITITSNDTNRPTVLLHMRGIVWLPVEVNPSRAYFTVKPNTPSMPPQTLKIFNRTDEPLVLQPPQSSNPAFSAVLVTNVPGQEFELKVILNQTTPNADTRTPTFLQSAITMITSATNMPVVTITAMADIQPEVRSQPAQVQVIAGPLPRALTNDVFIQNNSSKPLKVTDASVNIPGVAVEVRTLTPDQNYTVVLGFPQGFQMPSGLAGKVSIHTDNPRYATLDVPIIQIPGPMRRALPSLPVNAPVAPAALPAKN